MPGFKIDISLQDSCSDAGQSKESKYIGGSNVVEVARLCRWSLSLEPLSGDTDKISIHAFKCSRPIVEFEEITVHHGQEEIYRPGKQKYSPLEVQYYEVLGDSSPGFNNKVGKKLYNWWSAVVTRSRLSNQNSLSDYYLKQGELLELDGNGDEITNYILANVWPLKITPVELDYTNTDLSSTSVTFRYNKFRIKENFVQ